MAGLLGDADIEGFVEQKLEGVEGEVVDKLVDRYERRIEQVEEDLEADIAMVERLLDPEGGDATPVENGGRDVVVEYDGEPVFESSHGVERVKLDGVAVALEGRNADVHPEAVVLAERLGELPDTYTEDLEYQQEYQAERSLKEQGIIEDGELVEVPRQVRDAVVEHIQEHSKPYEFDGSFLEIRTGEDEYRIKALHNGRASWEAETLAHLAGIRKQNGHELVKRDGKDGHLRGNYWQAFENLKEEGVAEGGDVEGYELAIELPDGLTTELRNIVLDHRHHHNDAVTGTVIGYDEDENLRIRYDDGDIAHVTDYEQEPQMGIDVDIVVTGEEDGREIAELV